MHPRNEHNAFKVLFVVSRLAWEKCKIWYLRERCWVANYQFRSCLMSGSIYSFHCLWSDLGRNVDEEKKTSLSLFAPALLLLVSHGELDWVWPGLILYSSLNICGLSKWAGFLSVALLIGLHSMVVSGSCHDTNVMSMAKINKNTQKLCCYPRQATGAGALKSFLRRPAPFSGSDWLTPAPICNTGRNDWISLTELITNLPHFLQKISRPAPSLRVVTRQHLYLK